MKFGKHLQKRQREIPEYAASFVDYKALKKVIKKLSTTPIIPARDASGLDTNISNTTQLTDAQTSLQANKVTFFFRLERELEKVNNFYLKKEAELKLRLDTLNAKKETICTRISSNSKLSVKYLTLEEGFRQFGGDVNKLQQFVEINATAFSKILKKWDKISKSHTKELYLSRAVEVQPCFNREVISHLSDEATTNLLDLSALTEGEKTQFATSSNKVALNNADIDRSDEADVDSQVLQAIAGGNDSELHVWLSRLSSSAGSQERVARAFLGAASTGTDDILQAIISSKLVDLHHCDEINARNCLHIAAMYGRKSLLSVGLNEGVNVADRDIYGRLPLHYACMYGHADLLHDLITASVTTMHATDQNNYTPLIASIASSHEVCFEKLLAHGASIEASNETGYIPLNFACQHGSSEMIALLLSNNPQFFADAEGLFPQHLLARSGKNPHLLLKMRDQGADLDQLDKLYQWTPLIHAASEGCVETLIVLLKAGVSSDIKDEKGLTALFYAMWEGHLSCVELLVAANRSEAARNLEPSSASTVPAFINGNLAAPVIIEADSEKIPEFSLPPPIIPLRRYGHNFLESKTYVIITLNGQGADAIQFYDGNKYPEARLTISSKSSDLIPRNLVLPVQDEFRTISFKIDDLDAFTIDFDVFPAFGSKIIARSVASSRIFKDKTKSSGYWHLELFDPRLRAIGRISFDYQVVTPLQGMPLEISDFATYWKATSRFDTHSDTLVTGSSLSGEYVRLYVQLTADGVPVLYPRLMFDHYGLSIPLNSIAYCDLKNIGLNRAHDRSKMLETLKSTPATDVKAFHRILWESLAPLEEVLKWLPPSVHLELHLLFPGPGGDDLSPTAPLANLNNFADKLLTLVFEHARELREKLDPVIRPVVFSSSNHAVCTALNWKQPNYPIFLCQDLQPRIGGDAISFSSSSPHTTISFKETVRIAQNNNFMGLICNYQLLTLIPALIDMIRSAGLVLVADVSCESDDDYSSNNHASESSVETLREGMDGVLTRTGILKFRETINI